MILEGSTYMGSGSPFSLRRSPFSLRPWFWITVSPAQADHPAQPEHMLPVYSYRASGLVLAGVLGHVVMAYSDFHATVMQVGFLAPFVWLFLLALVGLALVLCLEIDQVSFGRAEAAFFGFWALAGVAFGCIAMVYIGTSIAPAFLTAGVTFAVMSLYGYTTGTDLSKTGSFVIMGITGVVLAGIVNLLLASTELQFAISVMMVSAFVALTAWETHPVRIQDLVR